jgi:dTMP kinase
MKELGIKYVGAKIKIRIINMQDKGFLIAIEGIDGTGKSTLAKELAKYLESQGFPVYLDKEPTDGKWGTLIRDNAKKHVPMTPEEQLELFIKDRREHVRTTIKPKLKAGKVIILDRYLYSTIAYQGAAGVDIKTIKEKHDFAPLADYLIVLYMSDIKVSLKRIKESRGDAPDFFEKEDYLSIVNEIFINDDLRSDFDDKSSIHILSAEKSFDEILDNTKRCIQTSGLYEMYTISRDRQWEKKKTKLVS